MSEIPVHCVIEALGDGCCLKCSVNGESASQSDKKRLLDSYAIVAGCTPLSKLNDVVLSALGFPQYAGESAKNKGLILIDNWKPLAFDQITDDLETPIEQLFKHIGGNRWTLNILVSTTPTKTALEHPLLIKTSEEPVRGLPSDSDNVPRPSSDPSHGVNSWYQLFPRYHPYLPTVSAMPPRLDATQAGLATLMANRLLLSSAELTAAAALAGHPSPVQISPRNSSWADQEDKLTIDPSPTGSESRRSRSPKYPLTIPQRQSVLVAPKGPRGIGSSRQGVPATCRLMFDPLTELPMLNEWFEHNSHPTCHDIEKYTDILNAKPYRRTYPPVSTHNVKIWFKNRRAKCKRL